MFRCPLFHIQDTKTKCCLGIAFAVILNDKLMLSVVQASCIEQAAAPPCRLALVSASCAVLIRVGWRDSGMIAGSPLTANSVVTPAFLQKSSVSCFSDSISEGSFSVCRVRTDKRTSSSASRASVSQTPTVSSAFWLSLFCHSRKSCSWTKSRHFMPHCIMDFPRHSVPLVNGSQLFNLLRI